MSSFIRRTKNPVTGRYEDAVWLDDYFGRHHYGVRFGDGQVYREGDHKWEFEDDHAEMIAAYREVLDDQEKIAHIFPDGPAALRIAKLRAVLAHLERTRWRAIANAPRDGTKILVCNGDLQAVAVWEQDGWTIGRDAGGVYHFSSKLPPLKYWMPLPPSPIGDA